MYIGYHGGTITRCCPKRMTWLFEYIQSGCKWSEVEIIQPCKKGEMSWAYGSQAIQKNTMKERFACKSSISTVTWSCVPRVFVFRELEKAHFLRPPSPPQPSQVGRNSGRAAWLWQSDGLRRIDENPWMIDGSRFILMIIDGLSMDWLVNQQWLIDP